MSEEKHITVLYIGAETFDNCDMKCACGHEWIFECEGGKNRIVCPECGHKVCPPQSMIFSKENWADSFLIGLVS